MGRYRGRREARLNQEDRADKTLRERLAEDPFENAPPMENPFAQDGPVKPALSVRLHQFWDSGGGKILLAAVCCVGILAGAVALALSLWIRPPALPDSNKNNPPQTSSISDSGENSQPAGPTDDELYPDDGYGGDMPTVSGNRKDGVYTFLLVGTDMDDGNTDTIMVVSYDTGEQDINIMSIPRDTMVNESWDLKKINSVYSRYTDGMAALQKRVKTLVGFMPDFYVKVDLGMFVELVDLIGGVEFDVPQDMDYDDDYQDLHIHLKKGVQVLDGESAMELVRFRRYSEGDIKRVEVQQAFMKALIKECLSLKHWGKVKAYIDLAMDNVQTDLEFGSVVWFASNVLGFNGEPALNMNDVYTCTLPGDYWGGTWSRSTHQEQSYVTIYPKQVVDLVNERFNPYEQRVTTSMLDAMSILSNGDIASSTGSLRDNTHNGVMAVRRGEAYYDEDGNLVYGQPPREDSGPEQDENGNYFILDEDGNVVYTDKDGTPLDNEPDFPSEPDSTDQPGGTDRPGSTEPPDSTEPEDSGRNDTSSTEPEEEDTEEPEPDADPDTNGEPDANGDPEGGDSGMELPDEPAEPDDDIPGWLLP